MGTEQAPFALPPSPESPAKEQPGDVAKLIRNLTCADTATVVFAAKEAAALLAKLGQGWIPITERLPDEKVDVVLAWFQIERYQPTAQTGYYQGGRWYAFDCGTYERLARLVDPTHWMPLPPPPPERP